MADQAPDPSQLVSAVMITRPARFEWAKEAYLDFLAQTWPHRRLVMVVQYDESQVQTKESADEVWRINQEWVSWLREQPEVFRCAVVITTAPKSLGELRNLALKDEVRSGFVCQWDDDDRFHPRRIEVQVAPLLQVPEAAGTVLRSQIYYHRDTHEAHWIDWRIAPTSSSGAMIPGTLLWRYQPTLRYPDMKRGEDSAFLRDVAGLGSIELPETGPWLYLRSWHNQNTTPHGVYRANVRDRCWKFSARSFEPVAQELRAFPRLPQPFTLVSRDNVRISISTQADQ